METSKLKFRCGADPEIFLVDDAGKHISAIGLIGAGKHDPLQIPFMPSGFTLQEDNVALEYGIPPCASEDDFVFAIQNVIEASRRWTNGLNFSKLSCTVFDSDQMNCPAAFQFGCEPDYDAWTRRVNRKPNPPHPFMRSAGGHVHVETDKRPDEVARMMDFFLGVPSVLMDEGEDRKQLYGKHGAMRFKPYGLEYRTLSNFWIFDEKLIRWVWRNTARALEAADSSDWEYKYQDWLIEAIDNNNKDVAQLLVDELKLEVI